MTSPADAPDAAHAPPTADDDAALARRAQVRAVIDALEPDRIVLAVPGTDYRLHLALPADAAPIETAVGKRIRGVIEGRSLKLVAVAGGGRYIEPVIGEPRIVTGMVVAADAESRRVLVDVAVPMWLTLPDDQDLDQLCPGQLVNGYVAGGAIFTPVP